MKVHIVQMLCPQRHCIFALAYEHPDLSDDAALKSAEKVWKEMQEVGVNPWCCLCKSKELRFEAGASKFASLEEAMPHLKQAEIDNLRTRMRLLAERN